MGEIYDEHDEVKEEIVEQADGSWLISGATQLQETLERFEIENSYDADTVGGWVGEMIQRVPEVGDRFEAGEYRFEVTEMDGFRVTLVRAEKCPETGETLPEEQTEEQAEA